MIKIVGKTIEIGAQFSSAGFGGIDRISSRHSGLGRSIRHCLLNRSQWVVITTVQTDGGFCVGGS